MGRYIATDPVYGNFYYDDFRMGFCQVKFIHRFVGIWRGTLAIVVTRSSYLVGGGDESIKLLIIL